MNIIGYGFLLIFLPIGLFLYWKLCRTSRQRLWVLCILSFLFYSLAGVQFMVLLVGLSVATFWSASSRHVRTATSLGVVLNLIALGVFKYWNFGAESINALGVVFGVQPLVPLLNLALPLGISFYVFKHVSYLVDVQHRTGPVATDMLVFLTYSSLFFQISAGPVSRFKDTGEQLSHLPQGLEAEELYNGLLHLSIGMVKKLLIADVLAEAAGIRIARGPELGMAWAWASALLFGLWLYFDFSGYTDIVIGLAHLFGVRLPPNFNNPYASTNPREFWQRWHISVSQWFQVYAFYPLSRDLLRRFGPERRDLAQYTATFVTMLMSGLWHGVGWNFVAWGGYHGLMLDVHAWASKRPVRLNNPVILRILFLLALLISWPLFFGPTLGDSLYVITRMLGIAGIGTFSLAINQQHMFTVLIGLLLITSGYTEAARLPRMRGPGYAFALGVLVALCLLHLGTTLEFAYVRF
jgi:alginate O-acetyltransferase complex protein AlgI